MIKIFADTGNLEEIYELSKNPLIQGFTTNPSLMKKAGITDYEKFCKDVLSITDKPVSFEVFADTAYEISRQAKIISSWGKNVYVKIPITNSVGINTIVLIKQLLEREYIKVNITAVFQYAQIEDILGNLTPYIISVFAGRIADTGVEPQEIVREIKRRNAMNEQVLWASCREVLNIYQAEEAGANIITVSPDIFRKYEAMKGKDLSELSLDTVKQFYNDAKDCGFTL